MGFPRQEHWGELPFPSPGDLPNQGIKPASPELVGKFFYYWATGKPYPTCQWELFDSSGWTHLCFVREVESASSVPALLLGRIRITGRSSGRTAVSENSLFIFGWVHMKNNEIWQREGTQGCSSIVPGKSYSCQLSWKSIFGQLLRRRNAGSGREWGF